MAKMIISFIALFAMVYFGIELFRVATRREKIQLIKSLGYTTLLTVMVVLIITSIIVLF